MNCRFVRKLYIILATYVVNRLHMYYVWHVLLYDDKGEKHEKNNNAACYRGSLSAYRWNRSCKRTN